MTLHQIWTGVNPPSVSYLATWQQQHGNDKLMACDAHHIPGPDARRWCTSLASALSSSARRNQSSLVFLRVFFFFFFGLVGGGGVVTTFTSNAVVFQQEEAADLTRRSGNDAIMEMNASKVSNWFPLRRRLFGPSAEEGVRVRHVKMTRRETSSVGGGEGGGISRRFCPCLQNLATSLSRRNTRWISSIDRKKAKVATVELKCPWVSKLTWQRTAVGLVPARENLTAVGSEPQLSPPSREPGRAKSKHMKSTRHRKLSLFKSEPLQDFTALSGTTPTTVRLTRVRTRFRCGLQK